MNDLLRQFEYCKVLDYDLDILHNEFRLVLEHYADGKQTLIFKEVSTFYFINDETDKRRMIYNPIAEKGLETSDIGLLDDSIMINLASDTTDWAEKYSGAGNVFIEIWDQLIIIEAKSIDINGRIVDIP